MFQGKDLTVSEILEGTTNQQRYLLAKLQPSFISWVFAFVYALPPMRQRRPLHAVKGGECINHRSWGTKNENRPQTKIQNQKVPQRTNIKEGNSPLGSQSTPLLCHILLLEVGSTETAESSRHPRQGHARAGSPPKSVPNRPQTCGCRGGRQGEDEGAKSPLVLPRRTHRPAPQREAWFGRNSTEYTKV